MKKPEQIISSYLNRNGYFKEPNLLLRDKVGSQAYKKGFEVRFVLKNKDELKQMQKALELLKIRSGKIFIKHNHLVLPVYGKAQFQQLAKFQK